MFMIKSSFEKTYAADVANAFIQYMLYYFSEQLGGFNNTEWQKTLVYFDFRCAYTGQQNKSLVPGCIIAHDKHHCGLYLYGNIVPVSQEVHEAKGEKTIEEFFYSNPICLHGIDETAKEEKLRIIREFQQQSGYFNRIDSLKINLQDYFSETYQEIITLTDRNHSI
jgi:hypothetical protein